MFISSFLSHVNNLNSSQRYILVMFPLILMAMFCDVDILATVNSTLSSQPSRFMTTSLNRPSSSSSSSSSPWPPIAWLMGFPNSGTFYTTLVTEQASGYTTATMYADEIDEKRYDSLPDVARTEFGPFRLSNRPFPPRDGSIRGRRRRRDHGESAGGGGDGAILTKNHCVGFCTSCDPETILFSAKSFKASCFKGYRRKPKGKKKVRRRRQGMAVGLDDVTKAVHLIRNPYDNIVARFHYAQKNSEKKNYENTPEGNDDEQKNSEKKNYENTPEGFHQWCDDQDTAYPASQFPWSQVDRSPFTLSHLVTSTKEATAVDDIIRLARNVPCYSDFYQYVQWHNNAFETVQRLNTLSSIVVRYEDYHLDFNNTVNGLLNFLNLARQDDAKVKAFRWNEGYGEYYTNGQRNAIRQFLLALASEPTKKELELYFEEMVDTNYHMKSINLANTVKVTHVSKDKAVDTKKEEQPKLIQTPKPREDDSSATTTMTKTETTTNLKQTNSSSTLSLLTATSIVKPANNTTKLPQIDNNKQKKQQQPLNQNKANTTAIPKMSSSKPFFGDEEDDDMTVPNKKILVLPKKLTITHKKKPGQKSGDVIPLVVPV